MSAGNLSVFVVNDMKKLLVLFIVLLLILSSCGYTVDDIYAMKEQWDAEYFELEEKYYDAAGRADDLDMLLDDINENYNTVFCYYDDHDPDITEKEAHEALLKIGDLLRNAGY